jgi:putative acetyltransferase
MPPIIRLATRNDVDGVIALIGRVFAEYGWIYDPATEVPDLLAFDEHYVAPAGAFWVLVEAGRVAGSIGVDRRGPEVAELHRLYLDPDRRGQGLGAALIALVLDWCDRQGIKRLELWTDTRFVHAHRLYERLGFERDGVRTLVGDINGSREFHYERDV